MNPLNLDEIRQYVNDNIDDFHRRRKQILSLLTLSTLLKKNPYLFRAKNITKASELVEGTMSAFLSSSEEKLFGDFLEGLAIFVAEKTTGGHKSSSQGVDLEFISDNVHYIVAIKSGPNWGNSVCRQNIWDREGNLLRCSFLVRKIILRTVVSSATAFAAWFVA